MATNIYGALPDINVAQDIKGKANTFYGLNYPTIYLPGQGYFHKTTGVELLKNNLKQLISTEKGERIMLPGYGLALRKFLFSPLDPDLVESIREEIVVQIERWLPYLQISRLRVFEEGSINIYGGHGLRLELDVVATNLNNTTFAVGANIL